MKKFRNIFCVRSLIRDHCAGAVLMSIAKSKLVAEDNNDWFIQDGTGSIWKVDLSFSLSMHKPARIYR